MVRLDRMQSDVMVDVMVYDCDCLDAYRGIVERSRGETIEELGGQPMLPEKASTLAVMLASLPMVAALHPAMPGQLQVWQVALMQLAVWTAVFWLQRFRYNRFQACWSGKVAVLQEAHRARCRSRSLNCAAPGRPPAPVRPRTAG